MPKKAATSATKAVAAKATTEKKTNAAGGGGGGLFGKVDKIAKNVEAITKDGKSITGDTARATKLATDLLEGKIKAITDPYPYNKQNADPKNDVQDISIMLEADKQLLLRIYSLLEQHNMGWMNAFME
jgi:hypothetical protein